MSLASGAHADFRGRHGTLFNFLSAHSLSLNVRISNASFFLRQPPDYAKITVHGTMITEAHIVGLTDQGRHLNLSFSASNASSGCEALGLGLV